MATLHTEFSTFVIDENKISAFDKKTYSYIKKYGDIPYDPVIAEETDWQIFYNLTELRKGNSELVRLSGRCQSAGGRRCFRHPDRMSVPEVRACDGDGSFFIPCPRHCCPV